MHFSNTACVRVKQVRLGDDEIGVLQSDEGFVFWVGWVLGPGLVGLGLAGLNEVGASTRPGRNAASVGFTAEV